MKAKFDGATLATMIRKLGASRSRRGKKGAERTIEGGRSAIVFLELDLGGRDAPASIAHVLHVTDDKGAEHEIKLAPLPVSRDVQSSSRRPFEVSGSPVTQCTTDRMPHIDEQS